MLAVGLKVLKNKLSEYVRRAADGETILITDRERVIAELVPPTVGRPTWVDDAALAQMVREGVLTPPLTGPGAAPPRFDVAASTGDVLLELARDRADR